jgi:hypothetical protein
VTATVSSSASGTPTGTVTFSSGTTTGHRRSDQRSGHLFASQLVRRYRHYHRNIQRRR